MDRTLVDASLVIEISLSMLVSIKFLSIFFMRDYLNSIDYILLDIDGVILDQDFDNKFWQDFVPNEYAIKNKLDIKKAKLLFQKESDKTKGSIDWYDLHYWEKKFDLDLIAIAKNYADEISLLPKSLETIKKLKKTKKIIYLTNCDPRLVRVKDEVCNFLQYADGWLSSIEINSIKENIWYWRHAVQTFQLIPQRCLFVDDNYEIVMQAKNAGISSLHAIQPTKSINDKLVLKKGSINRISDLVD